MDAAASATTTAAVLLRLRGGFMMIDGDMGEEGTAEGLLIIGLLDSDSDVCDVFCGGASVWRFCQRPDHRT